MGFLALGSGKLDRCTQLWFVVLFVAHGLKVEEGFEALLVRVSKINGTKRNVYACEIPCLGFVLNPFSGYAGNGVCPLRRTPCSDNGDSWRGGSIFMIFLLKSYIGGLLFSHKHL